MSVLGSVASTQGLYGSDDFPPLLEACIYERQVDEVGNERVCGYEDVCTRNERRHEQLCESGEERIEPVLVVVGQYGEPRKRFADGVVERRRQSPHTAAPNAQLF